VADVLSLVQQLGNMSPEELIRLGPVAVNAVRVPGKAIFVTEELTQILRPRQGVFIK
jgi:hypothetical protein